MSEARSSLDQRSESCETNGCRDALESKCRRVEAWPAPDLTRESAGRWQGEACLPLPASTTHGRESHASQGDTPAPGSTLSGDRATLSAPPG
ncbi:hypothetical protein PsYK624_079280 [Phanerochaete sordida]|uniref:Uncharacterized protein n=1 Tax=Phanerochaete sordida TaxID=48140 RepID=A0A9P3G9L0_9APHY|nr:hypothetical protein PsYK624_079280 [Phanerochaete sordida]